MSAHGTKNLNNEGTKTSNAPRLVSESRIKNAQAQFRIWWGKEDKSVNRIKKMEEESAKIASSDVVLDQVKVKLLGHSILQEKKRLQSVIAKRKKYQKRIESYVEHNEEVLRPRLG